MPVVPTRAVYAVGPPERQLPGEDIDKAATGAVEIIAYKVAADSKTEAGYSPKVV